MNQSREKLVLSTNHAVFELHEMGSCSKKMAAMKWVLVSVHVFNRENRFGCVMHNRFVSSLTVLIYALCMVDICLTFMSMCVCMCMCHKVLLG